MVATSGYYYPGARVSVPRSKIAAAAVAVAAVFGLSIGAVGITPAVVNVISADKVAGTAIPVLGGFQAPVPGSRWVTDPSFRNSNPVVSDWSSALPPASLEVVAPGTEIGQNDANGAGSRRCTVGLVGERADGTRFVVTAGHCVVARTPVYSGESGQKIGHYRVWQAETSGEITNDASGFAVLELSPEVSLSSRVNIDDGRAVSLRLQNVNAKVGESVCKFGAVTGYTCGTVTYVGDRQIIIEGMESINGDSGSPVFRVNRDGTASLVGLLQASDGAGLATANPASNLMQAVRDHYDSAVDIYPR